ncbi:MAG: antA/AntB antirepressor family protein [Oscillospiraceae bacterium]
MNELIRVNYNNLEEPVVSGRELHEALGIKTAYKDWFPRMCEYGFTENSDFLTVAQKRATAQGNFTTYNDHMLTIPMAKELCMIQRTDIGRKFRQYFISIEEAWNSPEMGNGTCPTDCTAPD